jgi:hypothetical protein
LVSTTCTLKDSISPSSVSLCNCFWQFDLWYDCFL